MKNDWSFRGLWKHTWLLSNALYALYLYVKWQSSRATVCSSCVIGGGRGPWRIVLIDFAATMNVLESDEDNLWSLMPRICQVLQEAESSIDTQQIEAYKQVWRNIT